MNPLSARVRVFLFLLVVAAPVTATLAFERAAQPAAVGLRTPGREVGKTPSTKPEAPARRDAVTRSATK